MKANREDLAVAKYDSEDMSDRRDDQELDRAFSLEPLNNASVLPSKKSSKNQ